MEKEIYEQREEVNKSDDFFDFSIEYSVSMHFFYRLLFT